MVSSVLSAFCLHIVFRCPHLTPPSHKVPRSAASRDQTRCSWEDAAAGEEGRTAVSRGNHCNTFKRRLTSATTFPGVQLPGMASGLENNTLKYISPNAPLQLLHWSNPDQNQSLQCAWNDIPPCHESGTQTVQRHSSGTETTQDNWMVLRAMKMYEWCSRPHPPELEIGTLGKNGGSSLTAS